VQIDPVPLMVIVLSPLAWASAWYQWVRPHRALGPSTVALLTLLAITFMGGFGGAFVWWFPELGVFGWKLPLLASRLLSGAGLAFALISMSALRFPTPGRVRLALIWLAVYLWPVALAALFAHLDRFDFSQALVPAFFAVVALMTGAATWFLVRRPWRLPDTKLPVPAAGAASATAIWLALIACFFMVWSVLLFATDKGFSAAIWAWPGDLLTTRLIAAMLLTLSVGAWITRHDADLSGLMLGAITIYGLTAVTAHTVNAAMGRPFKISYCVAFGIAAIVSTGLLIARSRGHRMPTSRSG